MTNRPTARAALALAALSAWLVALFVGWVGGGAIHLLLLAAVVLFPWRAARISPPTDDRTTRGDERP